MVNTEVSARMSFYYNGAAPVEKKVAKKCCSKKIEQEVIKYMDSFRHLQETRILSQNKEKAAYSGLGNISKIILKTLISYKPNFFYYFPSIML